MPVFNFPLSLEGKLNAGNADAGKYNCTPYGYFLIQLVRHQSNEQISNPYMSKSIDITHPPCLCMF